MRKRKYPTHSKPRPTSIPSIIFFILCFGGLITGTFYDVDVSDALYGKLRVVGIFAEIVGKLPFMIGLSACAAIIGRYLVICSNVNKKAAFVAAVGINVIGCCLCFSGLDAPSKNVPVTAALSVCWQLGVWLCCRDMSKPLIKEKTPAAVSTLFAAAVMIVIICIAKLSVNRTRFCDLDAARASFTPWYLPGMGGSSFFSGHATMAAGLLLYVRFVDTGIKKRGLFALVSLFFIIVSAGRISVGAHFLSDVSVAGIVAIATCLFAERILDPVVNSILCNLRDRPFWSPYKPFRRRTKPRLSRRPQK